MVRPSNSMAGRSGRSRPCVLMMPANDVITCPPLATTAQFLHRYVDACCLSELDEVVDARIQHVPQVGNTLAAGDEPEVERVEIARHGDVEALPVDDRRHRVVV